MVINSLSCVCFFLFVWTDCIKLTKTIFSKFRNTQVFWYRVGPSLGQGTGTGQLDPVNTKKAIIVSGQVCLIFFWHSRPRLFKGTLCVLYLGDSFFLPKPVLRYKQKKQSATKAALNYKERKCIKLVVLKLGAGNSYIQGYS